MSIEEMFKIIPELEEEIDKINFIRKFKYLLFKDLLPLNHGKNAVKKTMVETDQIIEWVFYDHKHPYRR